MDQVAALAAVKAAPRFWLIESRYGRATQALEFRISPLPDDHNRDPRPPTADRRDLFGVVWWVHERERVFTVVYLTPVSFPFLY